MSSIAAPAAAQMDLVRRFAGWVPDRRERLDLVGPDRVRFLHNLVTCEVRGLAPGSSARGFFTQVKGGVLADLDLVVLDDRLRLALPAGRGDAVLGHLHKYRIVERVDFESRDDLAGVELRGPRAAQLLPEFDAAAIASGERYEASVAGIALAVRARTVGGDGARYEIEVSAARLEELVAVLAERGAPLDAAELTAEAVECARIEDGELRWGVDYDECNFPQEAGDAAAISYTKGCYLGQEVVARIHYRGGVQRQPRGLRFAAAPPPGSLLLHNQREAGRVTSVALSPRFGPIGLALVHRRVGEPPTTLALDNGEGVVVVELPFGASGEGATAP